MIKTGMNVQWKNGQGTVIRGIVQDLHAEKVIRCIDGNIVTRTGSQENKVLEIQKEDGSKALRLENEIQILSTPIKDVETPKRPGSAGNPAYSGNRTDTGDHPQNSPGPFSIPSKPSRPSHSRPIGAPNTNS